MISPPEPTTSHCPTKPLLLVLLSILAVFAVSSCSWFDGSGDDSGGTVIADDAEGDEDSDNNGDNGDDNNGDDNNGDDNNGDGNGDDTDEEDALAIIRAAAVDSGVAPDQRGGTTATLPVTLCQSADALAEQELQSLPGNYLFFCVRSADDYWEFELFDPSGRSVTTTWSSTGFFQRSFSLLEPAGVYRLIGRSRSGGTIEAGYDFGSPRRLALEATTADGSPALAIAGYEDRTHILLAAYDAGDIEARETTEAFGPTLQFASPLPHLTDLGPLTLDPDGLTLIPIEESDVASYCIFAASTEGLSDSFACFGVEPTSAPQLALVDDGTLPLSQAAQDKLGRSDLWVAAPVDSTLSDGTVVTAATVTELASGRPIGAAGFVAGANGGRPELYSFVEDPDFVSSFAAVCQDLADGFKLGRDPCVDQPPSIVFLDPTLTIELVDVVPPKKPDLSVDQFDLRLAVRPDLVLDPDRLNPVRGR